MSSFDAFIFGLVQALTEFFPVSSSAHLKIVKVLLNINETDSTVVFDLCCHGGTLIAVLYFLRLEIKRILKEDKKRILLLFAATLPLIPCYFLLKPLRDAASETKYLGYSLLVTAAFLFLGQHLRFRATRPESLRGQLKDALWIGAMQSAALIPGISRSASTISCARALGWHVKDAVQFSFLLSIPTIIGGNCLELLKLSLKEQAPLGFSFSSCLVAFFTSLIVGFFVVRMAIRILEKGRFVPFAFYCLALGCGAIYYFGG